MDKKLKCSLVTRIWHKSTSTRSESCVGDSSVSEEFGPKLTHVKGMNDIFADALGRPEMAEEEFSAEAFAGELTDEEEEFQAEHPLSYKELAFRQKKDRALQSKFRTQPELCVKKPHTFAEDTCEFVAENNEIHVPKHLEHKCAEWCHLTLMHPSKQKLELTTAQRCKWIGLRDMCVCACKRCENCATSKKRDTKCCLLPPEPTQEIILWCTLCVELVGPHKSSNPEKPETHIELHCMTMVDPATGFFETVEISKKTAAMMANWLPAELHWLSQHPWPTEITVDKGKEFAGEVSDTLTNECGIHRKFVTSWNPQANSMIE